jgi:hypothetical protein
VGEEHEERESLFDPLADAGDDRVGCADETAGIESPTGAGGIVRPA